MADNEDIAGYDEFELDLNKAVLEKLPPIFESVEAAALTLKNVAALPAKTQGAYMLLYSKEPVYIGKTDATHGFQSRLKRHYHTLQHRRGLDATRVAFKAVRIMVFTMVNVESALIEHYLKDRSLVWQTTGFGSNDPGHEREGQRPAEFDVKYPVNIDRPLNFVESGKQTVLELFMCLKNELPYTFRYQTDVLKDGKRAAPEIGHADLRKAKVVLNRPTVSLREAITKVVAVLPAGWKATVFPGRVIVYKEDARWPHLLETIPPL